jgi:hypothetical protein
MFDLTIMNKNKPIILIGHIGFLPSREIFIQPALESGLTDTIFRHMNGHIRGKPDSNHGLPSNIHTVLQYSSIRLVTFRVKYINPLNRSGYYMYHLL